MQNIISEFYESVKCIGKALNALKKNKGNSFYRDKLKKAKIELTRNWARLDSELVEKGIQDRVHLEYVVDTLKGDLDICEKLSIIDKFETEIWPNIEVVLEKKMGFEHKVILSSETKSKLGPRFNKEIEALELNWNLSGDCIAFLFRKILEKAINLCFAKHSSIDKLKNPKDSKRDVGLERMLELASEEKTKKGLPLLNRKNVEQLKKGGGMKFLGDYAAHSYLTNVEMEDILPQLPVIQAIIKELAETLAS